MRGGKRGGARHEFGIDGRAQKLRELDQFGMRAALRYRIARHDHGMLCFREQGGRRFHRCPIPPQPRRHATGSGEIDVAVGAQDISGKRQEDRPGGRRQRGFRCAMHEPRQVGQAMHFGGPLDERARDGRKIRPENRLGGVETLLVLASGDENGRARLLRVVEHAHGVAETGRDMEIDHRELARGLRIAIRHRHDRGFLQAEQIPQLILGRERIHQRQFGGAGVAEHDFDALLLEQIEEGTLS